MTSPHVPLLFAGADTHDAALRLVAQLVRYAGDEVITEIVRSCLPENYAGDTLDELPRMITDARRKGFDQSEGHQSGRPAEPRSSSEPKTSVSERAIKLLEKAGVEFFHDAQREPFMSVPQAGGGRLNFRIASDDAAYLVRWQYYTEHRKSLPEFPFKEALELLKAKARFEGPCCETHLRIGGDGSAVYVDLGQNNARAVRITSEGWSIITDCPIKFYRSSGFGLLPDPVSGGDLDALPQLLGLEGAAWHLVLAFLVNVLSPTGPFMCLLVDGEQGSGKSLLSTLLKRIIDPNAVQKTRLPRNEHDLMIQASENRLLAFDNASGVKADISDALCSLATGGGYSTRQLYTDNQSRTFTLCRPFIINGIGEFASRPDLLERAIPLSLRSMPEELRKTEGEINARFKEMLPGLLGRLFDLVTCGLANLGTAKPATRLRMADAACWIEACEEGAGLAKGTLVRCLADTQEDAMADRVMGEPLALHLLRVVTDGPFDGTMNELLSALQDDWGYAKDRFNPRTPGHLSRQITRIKAAAAKAGLFLELLPRTREGRSVRVWKEGQDLNELQQRVDFFGP